MALSQVTWDDFSGGDWGDRAGWKAPVGTFQGSNVIVYRDGSIGPRPGLGDVTPAGTTAPWGLATYGSLTDGSGGLLLGTGTAFRTTPGAVAGGSLGASVTDADGVFTGGSTYVVSTQRTGPFSTFAAAGIAGLITTSGSLRKFPLSGPSATGATLFNGRMYVGASDGKVYYSTPYGGSAPTDFTTSAGNFLVGNGGLISTLFVLRERLYIVQASEIWEFTGTPAANPLLRRVVSDVPAGLSAPLGLPQPVIDGGAAYLGGTDGYVYAFDGVNVQRTPYTLGTYASGGVTAFRSAAPAHLPEGDLLLLSQLSAGSVAWWRHNGIWTRHVMPTISVGTIGVGPIAHDLVTLSSFPSAGRFYWAGTYAAGVKLWALNASLEQPALTTSDYAQPGDGSTTPVAASLSLPHFVAPSKQVRLSKVLVDATRFNTGSPSTNHLDVAVATMDRVAAPTKVSRTVSWDQAGSAVGATGASSSVRIELAPDCPMGGAFQVQMSGIRGLAIKRVTAIFDDVQEGR